MSTPWHPIPDLKVCLTKEGLLFEGGGGGGGGGDPALGQ